MDRGEPTVASRRRSKAIAGLWGDTMVFELPPNALDDALRLKRSSRFDPMGGRPMREWVVVLAPHVKRWKARTESALASVAGSA
jgi:hypothetical protein